MQKKNNKYSVEITQLFLICFFIIALFYNFSKTKTIEKKTEIIENEITYYDMMDLNKKSNFYKKEIISSLENIALSRWKIDSINLFEKKHSLMDTLLLKRLHDIKFEFGQSKLLNKIDSKGIMTPQYFQDSIISARINSKVNPFKKEIKTLEGIIDKNRLSLDSLRKSNPFKFYLNQTRFK